jgi:circadian clock protein KaiC
MLLRLIDYLKLRQITALMTSLNSAGDAALEQTDLGISSLIDSWILLRDIELGGERNRGLYVLKSRGMAHSNQIREFLLTDHGIKLLDVYVGPEGVLTGSMRLAQEAREAAAAMLREQQEERRRREQERKRIALEAQLAVIRADLEALQLETTLTDQEDRDRLHQLDRDRSAMSASRRASEQSHHAKPRGASENGGDHGPRS